jgi:hypothetical protein
LARTTPKTLVSLASTQAVVGNGARLDAIAQSLLKCKANSGTTLTWSISLMP